MQQRLVLKTLTVGNNAYQKKGYHILRMISFFNISLRTTYDFTPMV